MDTQRGPHILYLVWGFPPCRAGGVYRALATVNRFAERGWRVTVVTAERDTFERYTGADPSLEERIDPRVEVVRIPFDWPAMETDLRRWSRFRVTFPRVWRKLRVWRDRLAFPEVGYGPWKRPLAAAATRIHRADPVDLVVATANPNVVFSAAGHLHRRFGVPYVMDYRDAWLLDVFSGGRLYGPSSRAARLERHLISGATEAWFVNDPIRDWHRRLYPGRAHALHTVANGFDPDLVPDSGHLSHEPPRDRPLRFGYLGTVTPKVPLDEFLAGWRKARELSPATASATAHIHGYLGYYAQPRPEMLAAIEGAAGDGVSYEGPVGKGDIAKVYSGIDVQLLILAAGQYVTSGKVYEYLATGLPIVSVHDPDNAATDVLRGHPLWFPATSLRPDDIAAALAAAADAARAAGPDLRRAAAEFGARFRRDLQLDPRIDALAERPRGG